MRNLNHEAMLDANSISHRSAGMPSKVKQIEVTHHMEGGKMHSVMVEPGKMADHMAGCEHCGGGVQPDPESAAGAAT